MNIVQLPIYGLPGIIYKEIVGQPDGFFLMLEDGHVILEGQPVRHIMDSIKKTGNQLYDLESRIEVLEEMNDQLSNYVRNQFAAAALQGYRAHPANEGSATFRFIAEFCMNLADAMVAEASKKKVPADGKA